MDFDSEVFSKNFTGNGAAAIRKQIMEWYSADHNFGSLKIVKKQFERFNSNFATTYYQMSAILHLGKKNFLTLKGGLDHQEHPYSLYTFKSIPFTHFISILWEPNWWSTQYTCKQHALNLSCFSWWRIISLYWACLLSTNQFKKYILNIPATILYLSWLRL